MLISKITIRKWHQNSKVILLQNKTSDAIMSKAIKIQINQYFCNVITSMAFTFKMLSLYTKIDDIINLQSKRTFSNILKLCIMLRISMLYVCLVV